MKIYVVTRGCYSGYHIIAATTDKKVAEAVKQKFKDGWEEPCIEVFEDAEVMLKRLWRVNFKKSGTVDSVLDVSDNEYAYTDEQDVWEDRYNKGCISAYAAADEVQDAIKIAAEKRAKYLAEKAGIA